MNNDNTAQPEKTIEVSKENTESVLKEIAENVFTENANTVTRLTFLLTDDLNIRADVSISMDKIYYRFATPDSVEDGELPIKQDASARLIAELLESIDTAGKSEDIAPLRFKIYVNNQVHKPKSLSVKTLSNFIDTLAADHAEFTFLNAALSLC